MKKDERSGENLCDLIVYLLKEMKHPYFTIIVTATNRKLPIATFNVDFCRSTQKKNKFFQMVYEMILDVGVGFPTKCPVKPGLMKMMNYKLITRYLPPTMPNTEIQITTVYFEKIGKTRILVSKTYWVAQLITKQLWN